jgi:hypothetical protein
MGEVIPRRYAPHGGSCLRQCAAQLKLAANKIADEIGAPRLHAIFARLDGSLESRQIVANALDTAIANNMTPEQAAPGCLFGLLGAIADNAAAGRLIQRIVDNSRSPKQ